MAIVKFDDGSELDLSEDEFVLYLKATGKYVEPKSQAQLVAEKMAEIRNGATVTAAVEDTVEKKQPEDDAHIRAERAAQAAAQAQKQAAHNGHPTPAVMPRRLGGPAVEDRPNKLRIPVTEKEFEIIRVVREYHRMGKVNGGVGITTKGIAKILNMSQMSASGFLSGLFQTQRGIYRSVRTPGCCTTGR